MGTHLQTHGLILAAGQAQRFGGVRKQLLDLGGETILDRIIRQCRQRGLTPFVVSNEQLSENATWFVPSECVTTGDTLMSTSAWWTPRTIILLGDVIYSKQVMDTICNDEAGLAVFGNTFEIFALSFTAEWWDNILVSIQKSRRHQLGKLRYLYKDLIGLDMDFPEKENIPLETKVFRMVGHHGSGDYTRDVDSPYEWERAQIEILKAGRLDDLPLTGAIP